MIWSMMSFKFKSAVTALLTGIAKWLIENNKINTDFITTRIRVRAIKTMADKQSWTDIEQGCGIAQTEIIRLAVGRRRPATICTGAWYHQHVQGDDNVAMITNLLLLMGMIGIGGAGAPCADTQRTRRSYYGYP